VLFRVVPSTARLLVEPQTEVDTGGPFLSHRIMQPGCGSHDNSSLLISHPLSLNLREAPFPKIYSPLPRLKARLFFARRELLPAPALVAFAAEFKDCSNNRTPYYPAA
jgi:hypothetical protein